VRSKKRMHWFVLAEKEGCLDAHSKKDTLVSSEMIRLFGPDIVLLLCNTAIGIKKFSSSAAAT